MGVQRETTPVRVVYVTGSGRSGTTVLNMVLGQLPGVFAAGELRYVWQRGLAQNQACGCGLPFGDCPVWTDVMERLGAPDPAIGRRLLTRLRLLRLPLLLARRSAGLPPVPAHPDDVAIGDLYAAIAQATGCRTIVDTSKLPPYGLLLEQLPGLEVRVLHVVRDPRATAYSWLRPKATRDAADTPVMSRQELWKSSLLWLVWNVLAAALWRAPRRGLRMHYEDFAQRPQDTLAQVARFIGADAGALPFTGPATVRLRPTHSAAGNPDRQQRGEVRLRPDNEWVESMPVWQKAAVSALTVPGLALFGYTLWPRALSRRRAASGGGS